MSKLCVNEHCVNPCRKDCKRNLCNKCCHYKDCYIHNYYKKYYDKKKQKKQEKKRKEREMDSELEEVYEKKRRDYEEHFTNYTQMFETEIKKKKKEVTELVELTKRITLVYEKTKTNIDHNVTEKTKNVVDQLLELIKEPQIDMNYVIQLRDTLFESLQIEKKESMLCSICIDKNKDRALQCGHVFCSSCISKIPPMSIVPKGTEITQREHYIINGLIIECPICKTEVCRSDAIKVYLD